MTEDDGDAIGVATTETDRVDLLLYADKGSLVEILRWQFDSERDVTANGGNNSFLVPGESDISEGMLLSRITRRSRGAQRSAAP